MESGVPVRVELVDVSATALELAARTLSRWPDLPVTGHRTTYEDGIGQVASARHGDGAVLAAFLGSNIGNLDPAESLAFVGAVRSGLRRGDRFLLGTDLVKPEAELVPAYDDPLGVTAAFNLNVLARLNRELGADFDLDAFAHRAVWNAAESRMEMHLESLRAQTVDIPGAGCSVRFAEGESIWTESSYKYEIEGVRELGAAAGLAATRQWVDERDPVRPHRVRAAVSGGSSAVSREELLPRRAMRTLVIAASTIVVVAGLREASEILLPFLSALFIAVVSLPVMAWLQRTGCRRGWRSCSPCSPPPGS